MCCGSLRLELQVHDGITLGREEDLQRVCQSRPNPPMNGAVLRKLSPLLLSEPHNSAAVGCIN